MGLTWIRKVVFHKERSARTLVDMGAGAPCTGREVQARIGVVTRVLLDSKRSRALSNEAGLIRGTRIGGLSRARGGRGCQA